LRIFFFFLLVPTAGEREEVKRRSKRKTSSVEQLDLRVVLFHTQHPIPFSCGAQLVVSKVVLRLFPTYPFIYFEEKALHHIFLSACVRRCSNKPSTHYSREESTLPGL
jgi:hypothetical protein